jgi:alpha-mannosidase
VHVVDDAGTPVVFQRTQAASTTDDASRGALVFRAELPPLGYRLYRLRPGPAPVAPQPAPTPLVVTETLLENGNLRIELDRETGWIASLVDKRTGADLMRGAESERHTRVREDLTDTWGHRVVSYAGTGEPMRVRRIVVRETGPLRGRVRIERAFHGSTLVEELVLDHDGDSLSVNVTLDWREQAHLLKLRFPTALEDPRATFEIPFGSIRRPVDGAEEPAQSWVDLTGTAQGIPAGLTLITTNKHGYDVSPGDHPSIGVTAVRSPVYAWHDPKVLDPDGLYAFQDQGIQRFAYELVPHGGDLRDIDPARRGILLAAPVRAMLESFHGGLLPASTSFASDGAGGVMITALKGSEDGVPGRGDADLIVRAVETRGERTTARLDLPLAGRVLEYEFAPYQLRTFRVPVDPAAPVVEVDLVEWPLAAGPDGRVEAASRPPSGTAAPTPEPAAEDAASSASARRGEAAPDA